MKKINMYGLNESVLRELENYKKYGSMEWLHN